MVSALVSAATIGVDALAVRVECTAVTGLLKFSVVGLPDSAVRESVHRISSAIAASGLYFPNHHYTINLSPADIRKEGAAYDLPIALGLLGTVGDLNLDWLSDRMVVGELALDGLVRPVRGVLVIALEAKRRGLKGVIVPRKVAEEAALVSGLEVHGVETLEEAVQLVEDRGEGHAPVKPPDVTAGPRPSGHDPDLTDVKGQESVKRALEVAAAGGHNILLIGSPGSGKTMLARRLPGILPPLSFEEALETTKIHSVAGLLRSGAPLVLRRPFRSPHHTISDSALVGGGSVPRPGEISLAHHGVLFLDELPEFARNVLEVLRQPLEEGRVIISRSRMTVEYPAQFMMVCAMNPCPCGNHGNPRVACSCSPVQIARYMSRISGPLLDRIDLHVEVPPVKMTDLATSKEGERTDLVRERVQRARRTQASRFAGMHGKFCNAHLEPSDLRRHCSLEETGTVLLRRAMDSLGLSARAYDRILKVARTIADLAGSENIRVEHLSEAIQYRSLDRSFSPMQTSSVTILSQR